MPSHTTYTARWAAPGYELIVFTVTDPRFAYKASDLKQLDQITFKVTAVRADGHEIAEGATMIRLMP